MATTFTAYVYVRSFVALIVLVAPQIGHCTAYNLFLVTHLNGGDQEISTASVEFIQ